MNEKLYSVSLSNEDWGAVIIALRWHSDLRPVDKHVAFQIGRDRLKYIVDRILLGMADDMLEVARDE